MCRRRRHLSEYLEVRGYARAAQWVYAQAVQAAPGWAPGDLINVTELRQIHRLVVEPAWLHAPPDGLHRGDAGPLAEMVARAVSDAIYRFLLPGLAGPHRLVPRRSLADSILSPNALAVAAKRGRLRAVRRTDQWYSTRQWVEHYKSSRYRRQRDGVQQAV